MQYYRFLHVKKMKALMATDCEKRCNILIIMVYCFVENYSTERVLQYDVRKHQIFVG